MTLRFTHWRRPVPPQVLLCGIPGVASNGTSSRPGSFLHGTPALSIGSHRQPITQMSLDHTGASARATALSRCLSPLPGVGHYHDASYALTRGGTQSIPLRCVNRESPVESFDFLFAPRGDSQGRFWCRGTLLAGCGSGPCAGPPSTTMARLGARWGPAGGQAPHPRRMNLPRTRGALPSRHSP